MFLETRYLRSVDLWFLIFYYFLIINSCNGLPFGSLLEHQWWTHKGSWSLQVLYMSADNMKWRNSYFKCIVFMCGLVHFAWVTTVSARSKSSSKWKILIGAIVLILSCNLYVLLNEWKVSFILWLFSSIEFGNCFCWAIEQYDRNLFVEYSSTFMGVKLSTALSC